MVLSAALMSGCGGFIGGDQPGTSASASGDDTGEMSTSASSTGADSTTAMSASGGEDTSGSATTEKPASSTSGDSDTTASSTTGDGLESSSTTAEDGFPFEGDYTGSFEANCNIPVVGSLLITIDAVGVATGSASIGGQSANVTGTVDALGTVAGNVPIPGFGQCSLTGSFNEDGLLGMGDFNCPSVACSGGWTLAKI